MLWLVGAVTTFTCDHQYFANLTLHQAGDEEDWRCITGPDTTWIKHAKECPDCRNQEPPTNPVILSRPVSPLRTAPDNLEDRRGVLTEYRCGHHKVSSAKEKGIVLGVDKLGFLLIQSKHRCPRCFAHRIEESSSDDQNSTRSEPEETTFVPLDGSGLEIADNMDMGTLARQTRQREALATFDLPPAPSRRDSKREKAKKIGKSLWGSIKKKF
ncbi:hypothetical protein EAF00_008855 [Botryotinia globosa]|nr:hypothetical protein EAF00_008855 [Botryotinia globosa]